MVSRGPYRNAAHRPLSGAAAIQQRANSIDLSTTYLGLELSHPLMPGASPLVTDLDDVKRLEDAGAAAMVMTSLFEEQVEARRAGNGAWSDG